VNSYPFSAVAGLEDLKLALLINAVSPSVGGVLVRGEKGTAKSTIVRALAGLLPGVAVIEPCRFSCDPEAPDPECPDGPHGTVEVARQVRPARLVELPVGASEDRLVGSLDIERALTEGVRAYQPGLLAAAHRGLLYVDEVNLLHDHLVDLLLDAAAMGQSYVEREGVSIRHASRFLLVGTMNPEEGELRPQLLDRFGLTAEVAATRDPDERAEVVRRRLAYEADPAAFAADWSRADAELAWHISQSRERLPHIVLPDGALRQITAVCAEFEVDGLRADLVMARAAIALAAWHDRGAVTPADVRLAARLALPHRRRRDPFDAPGLDEDKLDDILDRTGDYDTEEDTRPEPPSVPGPRPPAGEKATEDDSEIATEDPDPDTDPDGPGSGAPADDGEPAPAEGALVDIGQALSGNASSGDDRPATPAGAAYRPRFFVVPGIGEGAPGRRSRSRTPYGRTVGARPGSHSVHLTGTLFAAAPYQRVRGRTGPGLVVRADDIREPVREGREGNLVLFVVDASGSMAARQRMSAVKGAVLSLLLDAYQRRDKVGLITFRGSTAETALPPTSSVEAGARRLQDLPTGGRTPLAAGLLRAAGVLRAEHLRDPARRPLVVIVTDGRATHGSVDEALRAAGLLRDAASVVVDCESGPVRLGLAGRLAEHLGAETVRLEDLAADGLAGVVRDRRVA
jgi:magnesium chelatase subunit D